MVLFFSGKRLLYKPASKITAQNMEIAKNNLTKTFLVLLGFIIITLIMTYPLVWHLSGSVVQNLGDPLFNTWVLAWDVHALTTKPLDLFNANIFYPQKNTLAFSEHMLSNALLALPLYPLFKEPVARANLILLITFILSAFGTYLLVKDLTESDLAAFVSGLIFAFAPLKMAHIGHMQIMSFHWIPFFLFFARRFINSLSLAYFMGALLFFILQLLSSWYLAIYVTLTLILLIIYALVTRRLKFKPALVIYALVFFLAAGFVIFIFAAPYLAAQKENINFARTVDDTIYFSAGLKNYLATPPENIVYGKLTAGLQAADGTVEKELFPGIIALLFATYAVLNFKRRDKKSSYFGFYLALSIFGLIFSFGPYKLFNFRRIPLPYLLFFYIFPGFKAMRVPARFSLLFGLGLAVLAGYGIVLARSRLPQKLMSPIYSRLVAVIIISLVIVEYLTVPVALVKVETSKEIAQVYYWLSRQKKDSVILEFPYIEYDKKGNVVFDSLVAENKYLYFSTVHWQKLVNGYSGYFPASYLQTGKEMQTFPSKSAVDALQKNRVDFLIIHGSLMGKEKFTRLTKEVKDFKQLRLVRKFESDIVYAVK